MHQRGDERQYLQVRCLSQYPFGNQDVQTIHQGEIVKLFAYSKQNELQGAVADTASARTAQQGADIRYIAGGTTLIDLMKLNVETPDKLVDITGLPLDKIETTSD